MAQNRDRNWQDRGQNQGGSGRGSWRSDDYGQSDQSSERGGSWGGSWNEDRDQYGSGQQGGNWQGSGGSGPQQDGEWNRMGRYSGEGWQGSGQGGGQGRWSQGGNSRMDRDYGHSGSRGSWGGGGSGFEGMNRDFGSQSNYGGSRGGAGYGSDSRYGSRGSYGSSGYRSSEYDSDYSRSNQNDRGFFERAGDEVASWFGDDDARRRREMDEHRGRGPKGYTRSDDRIRDDVNDRLTDDGWVDASDIEVQVSSSEVTLTGQVNSREEKRRAEDIVESISGVRHVQNNLRVKDKSSSTSAGSTTSFGSGTGTSGSTASGTGSGSSRS